MVATCRCDSSCSASYGLPAATPAHSRCCIASMRASRSANASAAAPVPLTYVRVMSLQ